MTFPPLANWRRDGMHRLIPSRWSGQGTVLAEVTDSDAMLDDIILLDGATNDRIQGELHGRSGISTFELVYGIPNAHLVNAAFTHSGNGGSRFSDETRGAWYAAETVETSLVEVSYHRGRHLAEIIAPTLPGQRPDHDVSTYDDWLADFHAAFHLLEPGEPYADYLRPEPVPACYALSQQLARALLEARSNGVLYSSVRRQGNLCIACFRPALVYNPRLGNRFEITLTASDEGYRHTARIIAG